MSQIDSNMAGALTKVQPMRQNERSPLGGFRAREEVPCHVVDG